MDDVAPVKRDYFENYVRGFTKLKQAETAFYVAAEGRTVHRIEIGPMEYTPEAGKSPMLYNGENLGLSRQPIYDGARALLARGATPEDVIETWRGGRRCMFGIVGECAEWCVKENKHGNPTFQLVPWVPFPSIRSPEFSTSDAFQVVQAAQWCAGRLNRGLMWFLRAQFR